MDILLKLFAPLNYLKIGHEQKRVLDFLLPLILGGSVAILYASLPEPFIILGDKGVLNALGGLLQFLTGFYVASLAAIATFPNKNMDDFTDGIPLKLNNTEITRRQYLSYMFGYLAFLGFLLVALGFIILVLEPSINVWASVIDARWIFISTLVFIAVYFYYVSKLMLTTLYGLYYLTEKIHQTKPEFDGDIGEAIEEDEEPDDF